MPLVLSEELVECSHCRELKPPTEFNRNRSRRSGLQDYCKLCQRGWVKENPERVLATAARNREKYREKVRARDRDPEMAAAIRARVKRGVEELKRQLFDHYGWSCACCGEDEPKFLTIDHVNGGGNEERRQLGGSQQVWRSIRRRGFPPEYRTLCFNCNMATGIHGVCPHERTLRAVV